MTGRFTDDDREWLEADGLGGFASGTVSGIRTRRYHALLLTAATPPTGRVALVNGFEAWVEIDGHRIALTSQRYKPGVVFPDGASRLERFALEPWPTWTIRVVDGVAIEQQFFVPHGQPAAVVLWRLVGRPGAAAVRLIVRPLLSGRDYHGLQRENDRCATDASVDGDTVSWRLYPGVPRVVSRANGHYGHEPVWYRQFLYTAERDRGLDDQEDLFSPGVLTWDVRHGDAVWLLSAGTVGTSGDIVSAVAALRAAEVTRRAAFPSPVHRAAASYVVRRGQGETIIAGYPWFTDWGRDTFIALRGLCLAAGRFNDARRILLQWSGTASQALLPNRFPDAGETADFNAVDASLWFIVAVSELCAAADAGRATLSGDDRQRLCAASSAIVEGYASGTRFGIRQDVDGLLACGEAGVQLTWMDARVGHRVVTPRIGKPVEVQALWLRALAIVASWDSQWNEPYRRGADSFARKFWQGRYLYDVVDVDHVAGRVDTSFRPNQVFALGGLGAPLIAPDRARTALDEVECRLLTPLGLRSLAPGEPGYAPHYTGGVAERDATYHQGTAWPWLMGAFVEAWLRAHGGTESARREAERRFVAPLRAHLEQAGIGHVSEIADAEAPFTPRGCPFQAWSLGELLRMEAMVAGVAPEPPLESA